MLDFAASQDASADLHTLTGSSRPDGVPTFTPVATATHPGAPLMALTAVGSAMAGLQMDAELIDLAERVTALAKREQRACTRRATIEDHVQSEMGRWPVYPEQPNRMQMLEYGTPESRITLLVTPVQPDPTHKERVRAYEAATLSRKQMEAALETRFGLPRLEKRIDRIFRRLIRWAERLTVTEPQTAAGLAAKAAASVAIVEAGNADRWVTDLSTAVGRDAVRIATAEFVASAADEDLPALRQAWEESVARNAETEAAYDAACDRLQRPAIPEVLFRQSADDRLIGSYGSVEPLSGRRWYGGFDTVADLRRVAPGGIGAARLAQILATYDRWMAEDKADEEASGYAEAKAEDEKASAENFRLRCAILGSPALTTAGIAFKIRVALWCYGSADAIAEDLAEEAKNNPGAGETAALSVLLDLARMMPADVQAAPRQPITVREAA